MNGFDAAAAQAPSELAPDAVSPQTMGVLRLASAGYATRSTDDPADTFYAPRLMGDVDVGQQAMDQLGLGGQVALTAGELRLADADDAMLGLDRYGLADGRAIRLRVLPVADRTASDFGVPFSATTLAFAGETVAVRREAGRAAVLGLTDLSERFNRPLQPARYGGTGGLEGSDEMAGRPKPVVLGRVFNMAPVPLGNVDLGDGTLATYQVHWRAMLAVDAVRIRGVAQTLTGSTPIIGQARAWPELGMVQLGSTPDGAVTCDAQGDAVGGYVSSTAGILRRLLDSLSPAVGVTDLDATAWTFAEADLPGEVGFVAGGGDTAIAAVSRILEGCGGVLAGTRDGKLRLFDPVARDVAQWTLPAEHILDLRPVPLPTRLQPLPIAVGVEWRPNWSPLSDVAAGAPAADRARLAARISGPERVLAPATISRQAQQRDWAVPGLYWAQADAADRGARLAAWLDHGPVAFKLVTDRYLGLIECGHIGRITYPAYGLAAGVLCCVLGWRERLGARRLTLTVVTLPEG
jgi:hypothetical protein